MDYARKIGKSSEPKKWFRQRPSIVTVRDEPMCPDTVFTEDRHLKNWKKWLENRKDQHKYVKLETGRHQTDQIMTSCETIRPIVEMRNLMDYATVPVPLIPDKYRGGPEFWKLPPTIPKRDPCLPDISFAPNKKDLNVNPELTYVGLPKLIEEEKDLAGLRSKKPLWKRSRYLKKRKEQLSREIELLVPSEPRTKNLIIKNYVPPKKVILPRIPPITISDAEDEEPSCDYPQQVAVLKIQDTEMWQTFTSKNEQATSEPLRWNLSFSSKVNQKEEQEIVFENKGNRVILYQWRDARFRSKTMHFRRRLSPFFFNKTKGVILPGQFVRLKVWYRSRTSGIFIEFWRLITEPEFCSSPLIFRFWGYTETMKKIEEERGQTVDEYLDRCIRDNVIREIIEEIIENMYLARPPYPSYGSLFLESEIFREKNPLCFYSPSMLIEFQKIYQIATNQKQQRWNLSINDLRDVLLKIKIPERRHYLLKRLNELYKECLKPTLYEPVHSSKHEMVYNLLSQFFNRFEVEGQRSRRICFGNEQNIKMNSELEEMSEIFIKDRNSYLSGSIGVASIQTILNDSTAVMNNVAHREIFFIRIYQLLAETMELISTAIDSFNNLNESDK